MHSSAFTRNNSEWSTVLLNTTIESCNRWSIAFDSIDKFIAREK